VQVANQIGDAIAHLDRHPDELVRWPFPALDDLTGPIGAGEIWFVCAFSGGGKTTFMASAIEAWRLAKKRVYVMPLELKPKTFRTTLACIELGLYPGDALSGLLLLDPARKHERDSLKAAVMAQSKAAFSEYVMISEQRAINVAGLVAGFKEAKAFGADVVIVDHIDHIEGTGGSLYAASKEVNHAALTMAQDNGLLCVFTSQLNMEIAKKDSLAKYSAPQVQHVLFPTPKLTVATGMIGLFRPVRGPAAGESPDEYAQALRDARAGVTEAAGALEKGVMGVVAMKLRNYGQREGVRIRLGVERGRVVHLPERDQWTTEGRYPRRVG
jgi:hypothetical protein